MGATNHTTNYNLPQFVGSDKPTWLGDVNGAMSAIDTQMKANDTLGNTAKTTADTALANAATAQTAANNAQTKADTADTTANSALTKALANESDIANIEQKFSNFTVTSKVYNEVTTNNGEVWTGEVKIAKNSDDSLIRAYGNYYVRNLTSGNLTITIPMTFNIQNSITIENAGLLDNFNNVNITINPTSLQIETYATSTTTQVRLLPFLFILKDFGSTPQ